MKYRFQLERLENMLEKNFEQIHMFGGGIQNQLLCQLTADATTKIVTTGPIEATTLGNVLMQMLALRYIGSLQEGREIIKQSFEMKTYEPREPAAWADAYDRFRTLL